MAKTAKYFGQEAEKRELGFQNLSTLIRLRVEWLGTESCGRAAAQDGLAWKGHKALGGGAGARYDISSFAGGVARFAMVWPCASKNAARHQNVRQEWRSPRHFTPLGVYLTPSSLCACSVCHPSGVLLSGR
jgi:hypothetical protein